MPTLQLKLSRLPRADDLTALAASLTRLTGSTLGKREEVTAVMIELLPPAQWYIAAQTVAQPTAWLEISITAGTTTPAQKAAFIAQANALLTEHLGALAPASYVLVRELAASDWGYGGVTQAARQALREQAAATAQSAASA